MWFLSKYRNNFFLFKKYSNKLHGYMHACDTTTGRSSMYAYCMSMIKYNTNTTNGSVRGFISKLQFRRKTKNKIIFKHLKHVR